MTDLNGEQKLVCLRRLMLDICINKEKTIQAYIITGDDAHQSEYIRDSDKRRHYISGFKGSYGTAVITQDHALLWTDGRYFTQARNELNPSDAWILMQEGLPETLSIENWLISNLGTNSKVGADPNLINNTTWDLWQTCLKNAGHSLIPIEDNLVDKIWKNKPCSLLNNIVPHDFAYTGKSAGDKVSYCFEEMKKKNVTILVLTALDEIAYLLNWRGSDIPYNPVFFAYVILNSGKTYIFIDEKRISVKAKEQLLREMVDFEIYPYDHVRSYLRKLVLSNNDNKVWISNSSSHALHSDCSSVLNNKTISPICLMKLIKTNKEIEGMKSAHVRDGIALVKYFSWLENVMTAPNNNMIVTEISGAEKLEEFRRYDTFFM